VEKSCVSLDAGFLLCIVGARGELGWRKENEVPSHSAALFSECGLGVVLLDVGEILECRPMEWVGTALVIGITALWIVVSVFHVEALYEGRWLVLY
jgi:hypothetical protein